MNQAELRGVLLMVKIAFLGKSLHFYGVHVACHRFVTSDQVWSAITSFIS